MTYLQQLAINNVVLAAIVMVMAALPPRRLSTYNLWFVWIVLAGVVVNDLMVLVWPSLYPVTYMVMPMLQRGM